MPLHPGKSKKVFEENVKEMIASHHPLNQSLAAAYSEKRKSGGGDEHHSKVENVWNPEHHDGKTHHAHKHLNEKK